MLDLFIYFLAFIGYLSIGKFVGTKMYELGFHGSERLVKTFGGITWPISMWFLLIVFLGEYKINFEKK